VKFRKKPVVIEAMQVPPHEDGVRWETLLLWLGSEETVDQYMLIGPGEMVLLTLEGKMTAKSGDWIIRGVKGELYPCKNDIFQTTYEAVDGDAT
jgi:hypothetical protein